MLRFKSGVKLIDLQPQMALAVTTIHAAYTEAGATECWITSANDGTHMVNSLHYMGMALDFRTHGLKEAGIDPAALAITIQTALGDEFDVVFESAGLPNEHIHCEYDPK